MAPCAAVGTLPLSGDIATCAHTLASTSLVPADSIPATLASNELLALSAYNASDACLAVANQFLCGVSLPLCGNDDASFLLYPCVTACSSFLQSCGPYFGNSTLWPFSCYGNLGFVNVTLSNTNCLDPTDTLTDTLTESFTDTPEETPTRTENESSSNFTSSPSSTSAITAAADSPSGSVSSGPSGLPTASPSPSTGTGNSSTGLVCPPPLELTSEPAGVCIFNCCLPCPAAFTAEKPGYLESLWKYNHATFAFSAVICAALVIITFVALPNRRTPHGAYVISLNIAIALEAVSILISIPNPAATLCDGRFAPADPLGNRRCMTQAFLFILGLNGIVLSVFVILLNLHLTVMWGNKLLERRYLVILCLIWGLAVFSALIPTLLRKMSAMPGFVCLIDIDSLVPLVFGPEAIFIFGAFILQVATLVYSVRNSRKGVPTTDVKRHIVRREIRTQWRGVILSLLFQLSWSGLLALYFLYKQLIADISYNPKEAGSNPWVKDWYLCLIRNQPNGQAACYNIVEANTPKVAFVAFFLDIHLSGGIFSFLIFVATNFGVLYDWREVLFPSLSRRTRTEIIVTSEDMISLDPTQPRRFLKSYK
ncbi:hypothetical protein DFJ73DRAFT_825742 [Zopfochytrium polystomum]|nr:hypothetical protein DFJ73DRAFT_825742 [Zopfochytrium polystomum]